MKFINEQIDVSQLPRVEQLEFQGLQKSYMQVSIFSSVIFFFILFAIFFMSFLLGNGFTLDKYFFIAIGLLLLFMIISIVMTYLGFKIKGYAIREKDIHYRKGLLFRSMTSIPFNRIQHCEVSEGFLDRMFDLAKIKIYTAGGSSSDLVIPGLHKEEAHSLRSMIIAMTSSEKIRMDTDFKNALYEEE